MSLTDTSKFWMGTATPAAQQSKIVPFLDDPKLEQPKEALRFDEGKTNWSLMPFEAVEEINKVLEFGANKYAAWNFTKDGGMNHSRILNSCLRHIFCYMQGVWS